jgi:cytochrome c556
MHEPSRRHFPLRGLAPLCLGLALAVPAAADEGAAEYREHVMEAIGGHMQSAVDILRGDVPHQEHLRLHVNALAELAGIADTLFPEGSEGGDALPEIWEEPEDFSARLASFQQAAEALEDALDGGGEIGQAVQELGQACKACHDDYRDE